MAMKKKPAPKLNPPPPRPKESLKGLNTTQKAVKAKKAAEKQSLKNVQQMLQIKAVNAAIAKNPNAKGFNFPVSAVISSAKEAKNTYRGYINENTARRPVSKKVNKNK